LTTIEKLASLIAPDSGLIVVGNIGKVHLVLLVLTDFSVNYIHSMLQITS